MAPVRRSSARAGTALFVGLALAAGCGDDGGGPKPPAITTQPADEIVAEGQTAIFSVTAAGAELTYQWQRSDDGGSTWSDISGATDASYTTPPTTPADSGAQFACVVTNAGGSVTSDAATLTVVVPPVITSHPSDRTVVEGQAATFSVTATGYALVYQWRRSDDGGSTWSDIPGATNPTYGLLTTPNDDGAQFACVVANIAGSVTSSPATLVVRARAVAVAARLTHSLALRADGTVWAWGRNKYGQLGDGTWTDSPRPVQVKGSSGAGWLADVQAVAAGGGHSLALKKDGTVWAWGRNEYGQLGDGTRTDSPRPVQVKGSSGTGWLADVQAIAAGGSHSLALKTDGSVWAWGWNYKGQLGDGSMSESYLPVQVKGPGGSGWLTEIKAVAAGDVHSLALRTDGTVWAWGSDGMGQLGDGIGMGWSWVPVQVKGPGGFGWLTDVQAVAAGLWHSLAVKTDGTVWAWGDNLHGQLGDGTTAYGRDAPVQVKGPGGSGWLTEIQAVAGGYGHSIAVKTDGTVWAWGRNSKGELGDGTRTDSSPTPVQVKGPGGSGWLTEVQAVAAGDGYSLVLKTDGTIWAWGDNHYGQLGEETWTGSHTPVQAKGPGGSGWLTGVGAVAAGPYHSLAPKTDGTVWAWGENYYGQLGDGTTRYGYTPLQSGP